MAIDAADVVLMNSKLSDVPAAIRLSRATLRNIHENLFWAFIYNIIGIPLAAGVFIPLGLTLNPMFGAAAISTTARSTPFRLPPPPLPPWLRLRLKIKRIIPTRRIPP